MKTQIEWSHGKVVKGTSENGGSFSLSGNPKEDKFFSPMEAVLTGLGGCSSMDVISILEKKRVQLEVLRVKLEAERDTDQVPAVFKKIHLHFEVKCTPADEEKVKRSIELSIEKYCSVSKMLEKTATITYSFELLK